MPIFISPLGNPEVWTQKPAGYLTQEEWASFRPLTATVEVDTRAPTEKRLDDYKAEADPLLWQHIYYQAEAKGLEDPETAARYEERAKEFLRQYVAKKQEIRSRYPDSDAEETAKE